jgi:hypothetical protein
MNKIKRNHKKRRLALLIGIPVLLAVVGVALFVLLAHPFGTDNGEKNGSGNETKTITLAQYGKVEKGMTYAQVVEILGSEGALQSEAGEKDSADHMTVYLWKGKNDDSRAVMVFTGEKMASKTHVGITDK